MSKVRMLVISVPLSILMMLPLSGWAHEAGSISTKWGVAKLMPPIGSIDTPTDSSSAQSGEGWQGTTAAPGAGNAEIYDYHEFDVLPGFDNDLVNVSIAWNHSGSDIIYDFDLYLDRQLLTGEWVEVKASGGSQTIAGREAATETLSYAQPVAGHYRARVSNFGSLELDYTGSIAFTSLQDPAPGPRATLDRPDLNSSPTFHVIYFVTSSGPDQALDTSGVIEQSVLSMNQWFVAQSGKSLSLDMYNDTPTTQKLDITFYRGAASSYSFTTLTNELDAAGFSVEPARKRYIVFAAVSASACGTAYYPLEEVNSGFAQWAVTFLNSPTGCKARTFGDTTSGPSYSESITAQELLHNEGLAPPAAPHHCAANPGHICTGQALSQLGNTDPESYDVMFPYVGRPLNTKLLDIGHDDYFNHPFPYRDYKNSPFLQ